MKYLKTLQSRINNRIIKSIIIASLIMACYPVYAQNGGLDKAKTVLESMSSKLLKDIIPVAATIILLCLAIGYAGRFIGKNTFIRWAIGVVIAGSAAEITKIFIS